MDRVYKAQMSINAMSTRTLDFRRSYRRRSGQRALVFNMVIVSAMTLEEITWSYSSISTLERIHHDSDSPLSRRHIWKCSADFPALTCILVRVAALSHPLSHRPNCRQPFRVTQDSSMFGMIVPTVNESVAVASVTN